ncbi:DinB family protein [Paenibacillus lentus]|uniref:DinB family protein n=1 Tax=Paenibacillus lentus TaxID=1338368 RepID=UPI0036510039
MEFHEINQKLKETRNELLGLLHRMNRDQINHRKDPNSWSVGQICQHLYKTEEIYVVAIKRGLKSKESSNTDSKSLDFLLDRSKKIVAPDIVQPTDEIIELDEIIEKLNQSRQKLLETLSILEDRSELSRKHFVHPVFKEMLLIDWVRSLYVHEQRHIRQIEEII